MLIGINNDRHDGAPQRAVIPYASSVRRFFIVLTRALAIYGFAAWVYVAMVAVFLPRTLGFQLTHFSKLPHTDTFGEVSFVVSFVSYFVYRILIEPQPPAAR
jgi:hypothetical protein